MPHYKCEPCRARLHVRGTPPEPGEIRCPGCGAPLEPVDSAAGLIGYQAITPRDDVTVTTPLDRLIADLLDPSAPARGAGRDEAEEWLDDGAGAAYAAVSLPVPRT